MLGLILHNKLRLVLKLLSWLWVLIQHSTNKYMQALQVTRHWFGMGIHHVMKYLNPIQLIWLVAQNSRTQQGGVCQIFRDAKYGVFVSPPAPSHACQGFHLTCTSSLIRKKTMPRILWFGNFELNIEINTWEIYIDLHRTWNKVGICIIIIPIGTEPDPSFLNKISVSIKCIHCHAGVQEFRGLDPESVV